jgi:hypothetical protein
MPVAELEARMGNAQELGEWQAFFDLDHQVEELVAQGVDPKVARETVWRAPDEE